MQRHIANAAICLSLSLIFESKLAGVRVLPRKTAAGYVANASIFLISFLLASSPVQAQQNPTKPEQTTKPVQAPAKPEQAVKPAQAAKPVKPPKKPAQAEKPVQAPGQTGALPSEQPSVTMPDPVGLNLLIRSTLMALNHANLSGNYSVLRDLGAPAFQRFNSAAALSEKFSGLRKSKVDFTGIFYFNPNLSQQPTLQDGRFLRLTGHIPTQPYQIDFDLAYQNAEGQWQLVAIAVGVSQAKPNVSSNSGGSKPEKSAGATKPAPATSQNR